MRTTLLIVAAVSLLVPALMIEAQSEQPAKESESAATGKVVNLVIPRCPAGCDFKEWKTKKTTVLRATPDEAAAAVIELAAGAKVQGVAAHTLTTYLPLCTMRIDHAGQRADCVKEDCERKQFRKGDKFYLRENVDGWSAIIEYQDVQYKVMNHYDCDGWLKFVSWVQVKLADGTTGWAHRDNFSGTEMAAGIIHIP